MHLTNLDKECCSCGEVCNVDFIKFTDMIDEYMMWVFCSLECFYDWFTEKYEFRKE